MSVQILVSDLWQNFVSTGEFELTLISDNFRIRQLTLVFCYSIWGKGFIYIILVARKGYGVFCMVRFNDW